MTNRSIRRLALHRNPGGGVVDQSLNEIRSRDVALTGTNTPLWACLGLMSTDPSPLVRVRQMQVPQLVCRPTSDMGVPVWWSALGEAKLSWPSRPSWRR